MAPILLCVLCMFVTCSLSLALTVVYIFLLNSLKPGSDGMAKDKAEEPSAGSQTSVWPWVTHWGSLTSSH